jgi:hypothetical protein
LSIGILYFDFDVVWDLVLEILDFISLPFNHPHIVLRLLRPDKSGLAITKERAFRDNAQE